MEMSFNKPWLIALLVLAAAVSTYGSRCAAMGTDGKVIIHLNSPLIEVSERIIKVKDVANVIDGPVALRNRIENLDLDSFENGQVETSISLEQIRYRLMLARIDQQDFLVSGTSRARVQLISPANHQQRIEGLLATELAIQFGLPTNAVKVTLDEQVFHSLTRQNIDLRSSHVAVDFGTELPFGNRQFEIRLVDAAGNHLTTSLPMTTAVYRDLVIAQRNISRGETIDQQSVARVRRPITDRHVKFAAYEQVVGKPARQDIQQFDVVRAQHVDTGVSKDPPIMKRNQLINAFMRRGKLTIQIRNVRTVTEGRLGDTIEILNPITRRRMLAKVIDANTVEVR